MALADFDNETLNKLRGLLGTFGNEKINALVRKSTTYIESQYFAVTDEVTITNNGGDDTFEYKAKEVLIDGSEVEIGITFDSDETGTGKVDETIFLPNLKFPSNFTGEVEVGKIYQVDAVEPDGFEDATQYYIIPKGGGGSTDFRLRMQSTILDINTPVQNGADIVTDLGEVIESDVTVIQRVFDTAQIYDEILFGYIDEEGYYCIDKSLLGV